MYLASMKVYTDTSVIGGYFDKEFQEWSIALWNEFVEGAKLIMISDLTAQELEFARIEIRNLLSEIPEKNRVNIMVDDEAIKLARILHY